MAGWAVLPPVAAAEDPVVESAPNKNDTSGSASAEAAALVKAKETKERVEVKSERTVKSTVWANPDGTLTRDDAQGPIRAKNAAGDLVPIDTALEVKDGKLSPKAATGDVKFSGDGAGDLAAFNLSKTESVSMAFKGDLDTPSLEGSTALYSVAPEPASTPTDSVTPSASATSDAPSNSTDTAAAGTAVSATALSNGFAARVVLDQAPTAAPSYTFAVKTEGLTPSLDGRVLKLSDKDGTVVAQSQPLQMWDTAVDEAGDRANVAPVDAELNKSTTGWELVLKPSMEYLAAKSTKYPVTVDPDIMVTPEADTYFFDGQSTSDYRGADYRLMIGSDDGNRRFRSWSKWEYKSYLGKTITSANLTMRQYFTGHPTCTPVHTDIYPTTTDPTFATWSNQPTRNADLLFHVQKAFNHGNSGCSDGFETIDVTQIVNAWASETVGDGQDFQGFAIRALSTHEYNTQYQKRFCSFQWDPTVAACNTAAYVPVLSVTYAPEHGLQPWFSMTKHPLNDRSTLMVNNKNGNAVVQADDVSVNGLGLDLDITRYYNSQATDTQTTPNSMGKAWSLSAGPDVWLEQKSIYRYDYHSPGGTVFGSFTRVSSNPASSLYNTFTTPPGGVDADLKFDTATNKFILTFHGSHLKYEFTQPGAEDAYLSKATDRSGNSITYATSGTTSTGQPKLSTITDTGNRTYAVTYTGDYITKIHSNTDGRDWTYLYNGDGYLTQYTDPDGKATNYTYTEAAGLDPLTKIEDPSTVTVRPTTEISYSNLQAIEVRYLREGTEAPYTYTWDYESNRENVAECAEHDHGDSGTLVTDPNGDHTSYCFDERKEENDTKVWVYDGEGNAASTSFSPDNGAKTVTAPTGQVTGGSTVLNYSTAPEQTDQLLSVTAPKDETGNTSATTVLSYDHSAAGGHTSPAGGKYLPGLVIDPNRNCARYAYDAAGRTTDVFSGIDGSSGTCGAASAGTQSHFEYNTANGTVLKSSDGNAGASPTDADKTIYTYWASGDSGFVAGSAGQVKTIRKPGGSCSAPRKLCTSYTYDTSGRVVTMTDGRGYVTTYAYDSMDRVVDVELDPATTCSPTLSDCETFTYAYDGEGNMTSRTSPAGNTNYSYDRLNRQTLQQTPRGSGGNSGVDKIDMSYDGNGNLLQYVQTVHNESPDTVTYTYDDANDVATVTDATGTINISTNEDGQTSQIKWPGSNRVQVDFTYFGSGKPKSAKVKDQSAVDMGQYTYDYSAGLLDTNQLQRRTVAGAGSSLNGYTDYTYDPGEGTLKTATNTNGTDHEYTHDKIGNVTSEKIDTTTTYFGYDRAGELCWKAPTNGTQIAQSCPATPAGGQAFTSDAAGNNKTDLTGGTIDYNTNSQLTSLGGITSDYLDLGNALRFKAGTPRYVTGPMGVTVQQGASTTTFYTRDPSSGAVLSSHTSGGGSGRNYFTEPNGNVTALYSPSAAKLGSYTYSPYGQTAVSDDDSNGTAAANPFRYVGGQQDKTSGGADGYYKLGARYYDTHGHFTQADPIVPGGGNYSYTDGDPINRSDPMGLWWGEDAVKAAARIYSGVSGIETVVGFIEDYKAGNGKSAWARVGGAAAGGLWGAGCVYVVGATGVGLVYCTATSVAIEETVQNEINGYWEEPQG